MGQLAQPLDLGSQGIGHPQELLLLGMGDKAIESVAVLLLLRTLLPYKSHAHLLPYLHSPIYPYTPHTGIAYLKQPLSQYCQLLVSSCRCWVGVDQELHGIGVTGYWVIVLTANRGANGAGSYIGLASQTSG